MTESSSKISQPSRRLAVATLLSAAVAGCSRAAPTTYDLSAPRDGLRMSNARAILIVPEPSSIFALDSERIVVRATKGELSYLGGAQWSDRMPRLLQARVVQTFENMGRAAVGRPGDRLSGSVQLLIDVRVFEVREADRAAVIELAAKLVSSGSGRISASRIFSSSSPVSSIDGAGVAAAMDLALARALIDLTAWATSLA